MTSFHVQRLPGSAHHPSLLLHVQVGGGGGRFGRVPLLTRGKVGRVPVPPVVRRRRRLEGAVVLGRLLQELGEAGDVHTDQRPGRRVLISCSSQLFPSGSLNET